MKEYISLSQLLNRAHNVDGLISPLFYKYLNNNNIKCLQYDKRSNNNIYILSIYDKSNYKNIIYIYPDLVYNYLSTPIKILTIRYNSMFKHTTECVICYSKNVTNHIYCDTCMYMCYCLNCSNKIKKCGYCAIGNLKSFSTFDIVKYFDLKNTKEVLEEDKYKSDYIYSETQIHSNLLQYSNVIDVDTIIVKEYNDKLLRDICGYCRKSIIIYEMIRDS